MQHVSTPHQHVFFWCGWMSLALALISPLHPLGEALFSAHMVQHEILMLVAAPLLVLSRPLVTFLWGTPFAWRCNLGQWAKKDYVHRSWTFLTDPLTAWWIHAAAIWCWHAPLLFDLTLKSELAHTAQHLSFFLSALLFWWALLYARGRKAYGAGVFFILHNRCSHRDSGSAADFCATHLVFGLRDQHTNLGIDAIAGSTDWRVNHVGSGKLDLFRRRAMAIRRVAEGE